MSFIIKKEPTVQNICFLQDQINALETNNFQTQIDDINTEIDVIELEQTIQNTNITNLQTEQITQNNRLDDAEFALTNLTLNNSLIDVDITGLTINKILKYDGTKWVVSDDAGGIGDVPNDTLNYARQFNNWIKLTDTAEYIDTNARIDNLSLNDLTDVFINDPPQIGQVLAYGGNN